MPPGPLAALAAQSLPVVGFLSSLSKPQTLHLIEALRRGLSEAGFMEGQSGTIDYRFAEGRYDRLPIFADELVRRPVSLIVAAGPPAALSAKAATTTIPIVFIVGFDPVADGLVASFNRPGGSATGIFLVTALLGQKRLELLRELNPKASVVALLVNPVSPDAPPEIKDVEAAAQANKISIEHFNASTPAEIDAAFAAITAQRPDGLLCGSDPFFVIRREQIIAHVAHLKIPAVYPFREFPASGGLISYIRKADEAKQRGASNGTVHQARI